MEKQGQPSIRQRRRLDLTPTQEELEAASVRMPPPGLKADEGYILARRVSYGQEEELQERVRVPNFNGTTAARVSVSAGCTRNLGDYNSAKVDVFISMPCLPEDSEIRRCYAYCTSLLDELVPQELAKAGVQIEGVPL